MLIPCRFPRTWFATGLALAVGCDLSPPPTGPSSLSPSYSVVASADLLSLDEEFDRLASQLPEFGGAYYDGVSLVVLVSGASVDTNRILSVLQQFLDLHVGDLQVGRGRPVRILHSEYSWGDLARWRRGLEAMGLPAAAVFVDTDERQGRIVVGLVRGGSEDDVRSSLRKTGAPDASLVIVPLDGHPVPGVSLEDRVRPTVGGLEIFHDGPAADGNCSLGANPYRPADPANSYWVTASHCSTVAFGPDVGKSDWYQAEAYDSVAVGEYSDPLPFSAYPCQVGKVCRWSDVALLQYLDPSVWLGGTVAIAPNPFDIPNPDSTQKLITEYWTYDQTLSGLYNPIWSKTGRTTATTDGVPGATCVSFYPDSAKYADRGVTIPGNLLLLCQNIAYFLLARGGDSGGPVFEYAGNSPPDVARLLGFFHAFTTSPVWAFFSPLSGVQKDHGLLRWDVQ